MSYISSSIDSSYNLTPVLILTSNNLLERHLELNYLDPKLLDLLSLIILLGKENTDPFI
jgi:hypothetical protein